MLAVGAFSARVFQSSAATLILPYVFALAVASAEICVAAAGLPACAATPTHKTPACNLSSATCRRLRRPQVVPLVLSCMCGLGMSHATYVLRNVVSATAFTVIGIMCKILTVVINCLIWDQHANSTGIMFLVVCLLAGSFYQQAPKRKTAPGPGPMAQY